MNPARTAAEAARNRAELRRALSAVLGRELSEAEALDLALKGVKVLEQAERAHKQEERDFAALMTPRSAR